MRVLARSFSFASLEQRQRVVKQRGDGRTCAPRRRVTAEQELEIVLAGLRGDRSVRDVCREYEIAETLYYQWRDRLLEGGKTALATPRDTTVDPKEVELREVKKRISQLERALGRKTYELEVAGELSRDWT
jgi:transposase